MHKVCEASRTFSFSQERISCESDWITCSKVSQSAAVLLLQLVKRAEQNVATEGRPKPLCASHARFEWRWFLVGYDDNQPAPSVTRGNWKTRHVKVPTSCRRRHPTLTLCLKSGRFSLSVTDVSAFTPQMEGLSKDNGYGYWRPDHKRRGCPRSLDSTGNLTSHPTLCSLGIQQMRWDADTAYHVGPLILGWLKAQLPPSGEPA